MKKISLYTTLALVLALMLSGSAVAVTIDEVGNPGDQFWGDSAQAIAAKVRNGQFDVNGDNLISQLVLGTTDLNNPANIRLQASRYDLWVIGVPYHFTLEHVSTTSPFIGLTSLSVTGGTIPPTFGVGDSFNYGDIYTIRLNYVGGDDAGVKISNLTLNGTPMGVGTYDSGNTGSSDNFVYFRYSDGTPFTKNFTIAGDFEFAGSYDGNTPRFEFDLSPQPIPLPSALLLLGSGLLCLAAYRRRLASKG